MAGGTARSRRDTEWHVTKHEGLWGIVVRASAGLLEVRYEVPSTRGGTRPAQGHVPDHISCSGQAGPRRRQYAAFTG